jgi:cytoskeletal protein RodZ
VILMIDSVSARPQALNAYTSPASAPGRAQETQKPIDNQNQQNQQNKIEYQPKEASKIEVPQREVPQKDVVLVPAEQVLRSQEKAQAYTPSGNKNPYASGLSGINIDTTA